MAQYTLTVEEAPNDMYAWELFNNTAGQHEGSGTEYTADAALAAAQAAAKRNTINPILEATDPFAKEG